MVLPCRKLIIFLSTIQLPIYLFCFYFTLRMTSLAEDIGIKFGVPPLKIGFSPAASGASSKRFYRLHGLPEGIFPSPVIVLQAPGTVLKDYVEVSTHLSQNGIRCPKIFYQDHTNDYLLLEDCGTLSLEKIVNGSSEPVILFHYRSILDILCSMQKAQPAISSVVTTRFFDLEKYDYEYRFHVCGMLISQWLRHPLSQDEQRIFDEFSMIISTELSKLPNVFVHRDFQSSNLILIEDEWVVTDHQDARMGPLLYDLVALIEDAYVHISQSMKEELLGYYRKQAVSLGIPVPPPIDFVRIYDWITIQRKLHDAGAFVFSFQNFGNEKYLSYIDDAVGQALDVMSRYTEFAQPFELLTKISHEHLTKK